MKVRATLVAAVGVVMVVAAVAFAASAAQAATTPPKVHWADDGLDSIDICFPQAKVLAGFHAQLRVAHSWLGHATPAVHTYAFSFNPPTKFRALKYRGWTGKSPAWTGQSFVDQDCLKIAPSLDGGALDRIGFLAFTYIYAGRPVSSARYKYHISGSPDHYAKQGSDEFFNYCLKQHPETVQSFGGVLRCFVPSIGALVAYRRV
jgi:hypothetical protein